MLKQAKVLMAALLLTAGCASAPVGPTSGVAQGTVKGNVSDVNKRAQDVLKQMNIDVTGSATRNSGNEMELSGKQGDTDVTVTIDNGNNNTSNVEVKASRNIMSGNKNLAQDILSRIVQSG